MNKELSYLNEDGFTVFTSHYLKNKGTCCRSACLHCPYGFTLKKHGLEFKDFTIVDEAQLIEVIRESGTNPESFTWQDYQPENIKFILLKGQLCGILFKNHIVVKQIFLLSNFQHQGLSKELIESYYFI